MGRRREERTGSIAKLRRAALIGDSSKKATYSEREKTHNSTLSVSAI